MTTQTVGLLFRITLYVEIFLLCIAYFRSLSYSKDTKGKVFGVDVFWLIVAILLLINTLDVSLYLIINEVL